MSNTSSENSSLSSDDNFKDDGEWMNHPIETFESNYCLPCHYDKLKPISNGSYGMVCEAIDRLKQTRVAIKKVACLQDQRLAQRVYRELKLLKHVEHDNLIKYYDAFTDAQSASTMKDIYIVTELMYCDLGQILRTQKLSDYTRILITYQLFVGIKYLHSCNIIHRDLKPQNICLTKNSELKIIDFGLSRTETKEMTGYVTTRWYRAPELLVDATSYTKKVDMWSLGCIIAQLFTGNPLFPGSNAFDQFKRIISAIGFLDEELLNGHYKDGQKALKSLEKFANANPLGEILSNIDAKALDLISKLLCFDPTIRLSVDQALVHEYVKKYHDEDDEPTGITFDDKYERINCTDLTVERWRELIFDELKRPKNKG